MKPHVGNTRTWRRAMVFGVSLGVLGGLLLGRQRDLPRRATRLDLWQRLMARRRGTVEAALLAARVQARYEELFHQRPRFAQRALQLHLDHNLLPGLALYQVLREAHGAAEAALAEWDELVGAAQGSPAQQAVRLLRYVPGDFAIFRAATHGLMLAAFPAEGWTYSWVEDSARRIAFNIEHCFYLTVLTHYGAPELTAHFCRLDDLMAAALPPSIEWARTTTLARGGSACDFCWQRAGPRPQEATHAT